MASLAMAIPAVTSVFSGILGSSASSNAAAIQQAQAQQSANAELGAGQGIQSAYLGGQGQIQGATQTGTDAINSAVQSGQGSIASGTAGAQNALSGALSPQLANLAPYLQAGQSGLSGLQNFLSSTPGFSFDPSQIQNTPEYQFQLQQGTQAVQQSAAASGSLLSGGTLKALDQYSQGLASTAYQQAYNNALTTYNTNYQNKASGLLNLTGLGTQATNSANSAYQNYGSSLSQLLYGSGVTGANYGLSGTQSASQLGLSGTSAAAQLGLSGANAAAGQTNAAQNLLVGGANAQAAGTIGSANAWSNALGGVANAAQYAINPYGSYGNGQLPAYGSAPASSTLNPNTAANTANGAINGFVPQNFASAPIPQYIAG